MNQMQAGNGAGEGGDLDWKIVTAVADVKNVDPLELDERLYDVVDVDAIRELFLGVPHGSPGVEGHVSFRFNQCKVRVDDRCEVSVVQPSSGQAAD